MVDDNSWALVTVESLNEGTGLVNTFGSFSTQCATLKSNVGYLGVEGTYYIDTCFVLSGQPLPWPLTDEARFLYRGIDWITVNTRGGTPLRR